MKERFIAEGDLIYWIELDHFVGDMPVYKAVPGLYLGSYKLGDNIKHIVTPSITSCVVRHVPDGFVLTSESKAYKMLEKVNNERL